MEQKRTIWIRLIPLLLFAALMTVFAFADLDISVRLVNTESAFGRFAECSAEVPFDLITMFAYAILLVTRAKKKSIWTVLAVILFFVATYEYGFFVLYYVMHFLGVSWKIWGAVAGAAVFGTLAILFAKKLTRADRDAWVRTAVIVVVAVLLQEAFVNVLKLIWARPRMRDLIAPYDGFMPWYLPHSSTQGGDSFPSGHTARAAGSLLLVLLCSVCGRLKNRKWLFALVAVVWTSLIGVGRIVLAAHFASDVTTGAFLMLLAFGIASAAVNRVYMRRDRTERHPETEQNEAF